jgi:DNA polymerase-3 subunit alpha
VDIFEPEGDDLANGVTFEDAPDKKSKVRKTASTDYGKIAKAMGEIMSAGINVSLVDINRSDFGFKPDVEHNQILYGMKGMLNVSDSTVNDIIANRPYESPRDFLNKVHPTKSTMISLIKGGAFDTMMDRKSCMAWYLWETCDKKKRLTLQNMGGLIKHNLLPETTSEQVMARRIYEFNRYLKSVCKDASGMYKLDQRAIDFIIELGCDYLFKSNGGAIYIGSQAWDKIYQKWMDIFRHWINDNKDTILQSLNDSIFKEDWIKYAGKGNISAWEMEVLCFYYHDHELKSVNKDKYGFVDFFSLPEEPVVEKTFSRGGKDINIFKLYRICGTCIAKNKTKSTITLLTPTGVVNVKFRKEYFSLFDKQISERGADNVKHVMEKSWFNRGSMVVVTGIRSGDDFISKKYASTGGHQLYKITTINDDGTLELQTERYKGGEE